MLALKAIKNIFYFRFSGLNEKQKPFLSTVFFCIVILKNIEKNHFQSKEAQTKLSLAVQTLRMHNLVLTNHVLISKWSETAPGHGLLVKRGRVFQEGLSGASVLLPRCCCFTSGLSHRVVPDAPQCLFGGHYLCCARPSQSRLRHAISPGSRLCLANKAGHQPTVLHPALCV